MSDRVDVLIVEDDVRDGELISAYLEMSGPERFVTTRARTHAGAVAALAESSFDVVLLDLQLPDASGLEGLRQLLPHTAAPVVVLTGRDDQSVALAALELGAQDYLRKGVFEPEQLARALRYAMVRHRMAAMAVRERRLAELLERIPVGVFALDPKGLPSYANRRAIELLGRGVEPDCPPEALSETYRAFRAGTDEPYPDDQLPIVQALGGERTNIEDLEIDRDGERVRVQVSGSPLYDEQGQLECAVAVFDDITERYELERRLRHIQKTEALGRLAASIAHDFNNVLSAIVSFTRFAVEDARVPSVRDDLQEVLKVCEQGSGLTRQLLAFVRGERALGRVVVVDDLVADLAPLFRRVVGGDIEIRLQLGAEATRVRIDPSALQQVLLNLVVNARDAMPDGGVVEIGTTAGPDGVVLRVVDSGAGVPEEIAERIFEPMFTTKAVGKGTGLGLATCRSIVEQAEGSIRCDSASGSTVFEVRLPAAAPGDLSTPGPGTAPRASGHRILVVDDEPGVRRAVARTLSRAGHDVAEAGSAEEALELIRSPEVKPFEILLSDLIMPGASGLDLKREVLRAGSVPSVLLMTGFVGKLGAGVEGPLLTKPFTPEQLLEAIREAAPRASHAGVG